MSTLDPEVGGTKCDRNFRFVFVTETLIGQKNEVRNLTGIRRVFLFLK